MFSAKFGFFRKIISSSSSSSSEYSSSSSDYGSSSSSDYGISSSSDYGSSSSDYGSSSSESKLGVLDNHINSTILNLISNKDPSTDKVIYNTQNPYTNNFIRNTNCWLYGVGNISCASPAQMSGSLWYQRAGTLISPRHVVLAKHYTIGVGYDLKFVADDNTVITRQLESMILDPNNDIAMYLLDSDVPNSIKFAKVLPKDHPTYLSQSTTHRYSVYFDQEEKALLGINTYLPYHPNPPGYQNVVYVQNPQYINNATPEDLSLQPWYETPISGDSGNPIFLIIDNELVLISTWTTPVSGPAYCGLFDNVNNLMSQLGGGYQLTPIDLEAVYNKYK